MSFRTRDEDLVADPFTLVGFALANDPGLDALLKAVTEARTAISAGTAVPFGILQPVGFDVNVNSQQPSPLDMIRYATTTCGSATTAFVANLVV